MKCVKCQKRHEHKIYEVKSGPYFHVYDVELAIGLAKDLPVQEFSTEVAKSGLIVNDFDPDHLDHVNMDVPVLYGMEEMPEDAIMIHHGEAMTGREAVSRSIQSGALPLCLVFLDGSHRVARAVRDHLPTVKAHVLNLTQTKQCLILQRKEKNG